MVEITCRTLQSRMLLRPSPQLREIMIGAIGRGQRIHGMRIHAVAALSNHYHALVTPRSAEQLGDFMSLVNAKIAKEAARLHDWPQKVWSRRYEPIVVTNEELAQVGRLAYLLAHGCKEGLVADPRDWPGLHCAQALIRGEPLRGLWFDRAAEYEARRRRTWRTSSDFASVETIRLSPLPCWGHLSPDEVRRRTKDLLDMVISQSRTARASARLEEADPHGFARLHPHHRPSRTKRSPAPMVHAASEEARQAFLGAYRLFVASRRP